MWHWGDEIVVGFTVGAHRQAASRGHAIDKSQPVINMQARSLDRGAYLARSRNSMAPARMDVASPPMST